ncbi:MAG: hypothetical protein AAFQ36_13895 [Pseudomonadota bacterium]
MTSVEARSVIYLRLWCEGPDQQAEVWNNLATTLPPHRARKALRAFETLCDLCFRNARRPMMRHDSKCSCVGGDEACFANFVAAAGSCEREDAMLFISNIVRPGAAPILVQFAQEFALALHEMSATPRISSQIRSPALTLH